MRKTPPFIATDRPLRPLAAALVIGSACGALCVGCSGSSANASATQAAASAASTKQVANSTPADPNAGDSGSAQPGGNGADPLAGLHDCGLYAGNGIYATDDPSNEFNTTTTALSVTSGVTCSNGNQVMTSFNAVHSALYNGYTDTVDGWQCKSYGVVNDVPAYPTLTDGVQVIATCTQAGQTIDWFSEQSGAADEN